METVPKTILIVTASPDSTETFEKSYLYTSVQKLQDASRNPQLDVMFSPHINNKTGLSTLYNLYLTPQYKDFIVVFVHDDVSIQDLMFSSKLRTAHQTFDIVGLAGGDGAKAWNYDVPPLWHLMSDKRFGAVAHPTEADKALTVASFGPTPRPCTYIDGLFISVDVEKALATGIRFDEDFDFHCYDLALCERAKHKLMSVGVWPIWVVHQGLGDSYQSESWQNNAKKFIQKYRGRTIQ